MKTSWQILNPPAQLLSIMFLLTPVVCLAATADQSLPRKFATRLTPVVSGVALAEQEVTPASCDDTCCGSCGGKECCGGSCEVVCCPKRVTKEVKKHCWLVEPKYVCIPGFRFPWERYRGKHPNCGDGCDGSNSCCTPVCGRVRCVNTLEKHEYKCEECGYEWNVKCVRSSNQCGSCSNCDCPSCGLKSACDG